MNIGLIASTTFSVIATIALIIVLGENSKNKKMAKHSMGRYNLSRKQGRAMRQYYKEIEKSLKSENEVLQLEMELIKAEKENEILRNELDKCLLEARDNKIEAQNAKIIMLQADCSRLQRELAKAKKPKISVITDDSVDNKNKKGVDK